MENARSLAITGNHGQIFVSAANLFAIIDDCREQRRITAADLCVAAGVHGTTYSRIRRGSLPVTLNMVEKLIGGLDRIAAITAAADEARAEQIRAAL